MPFQYSICVLSLGNEFDIYFDINGNSGFLLKNMDREEIIKAIWGTCCSNKNSNQKREEKRDDVFKELEYSI